MITKIIFLGMFCLELDEKKKKSLHLVPNKYECTNKLIKNIDKIILGSI
jgi:hypothetical protein